MNPPPISLSDTTVFHRLGFVLCVLHLNSYGETSGVSNENSKFKRFDNIVNIYTEYFDPRCGFCSRL